MDLESEDEDKENEESGENGVEEEVEDEKNTSHCMEELWEGGKIIPSSFTLKLTSFVLLKVFSCLRSLEENVRGSYRCVEICNLLLNR